MNLKLSIGLILFALILAGCRTYSAETQVETNVAENSSNSRRIYKNRSPFMEREVFDYKKNPALAAVGRINFVNQRWCSLILVSENIAVTAGHCFYEPNIKTDLTVNLEPHQTSVIFKPNGVNRLENISVEKVLKIERSPDYAIVKLSGKIPGALIKPLKFKELTFHQMLAIEDGLGCAGFNGDKKIGNRGAVMTISRNIKLNDKTSKSDKVDTNCFSSRGGSGGLFFEERLNAETNAAEYEMLGVIWSATDGEADERGVYVEDRNVRTSITPMRIFSKELEKIIEENH